VCVFPHEVPDNEFRTVGDIFSPATNPDRKKPFDIRTLMHSVADQDHKVLERWSGMAGVRPRWSSTRTLAGGRSR